MRWRIRPSAVVIRFAVHHRSLLIRNRSRSSVSGNEQRCAASTLLCTSIRKYWTRLQRNAKKLSKKMSVMLQPDRIDPSGFSPSSVEMRHEIRCRTSRTTGRYEPGTSYRCCPCAGYSPKRDQASCSWMSLTFRQKVGKPLPPSVQFGLAAHVPVNAMRLFQRRQKLADQILKRVANT